METENQSMTVREAGKRGGDSCKAKYGPEYYRQIGKLGGERTKAKYGESFYSEIGMKGGRPHGTTVEPSTAEPSAESDGPCYEE